MGALSAEGAGRWKDAITRVIHALAEGPTRGVPESAAHGEASAHGAPPLDPHAASVSGTYFAGHRRTVSREGLHLSTALPELPGGGPAREGPGPAHHPLSLPPPVEGALHSSGSFVAPLPRMKSAGAGPSLEPPHAPVGPAHDNTFIHHRRSASMDDRPPEDLAELVATLESSVFALPFAGRARDSGMDREHAPPALPAVEPWGDDGISGDNGGGETWCLVGVTNGLRLFEEASGSRPAPCFKAFGMVPLSTEAVFRLVMDLGPALRSQWDAECTGAELVSTSDGHRDLIRLTYRGVRLGGGLWTRPRELLVSRYWRREDDGTYLVLYKSAESAVRPTPPRGHVRAWLHEGGFLISPRSGGGSLVTHLIELDPCGWLGSIITRPLAHRLGWLEALPRSLLLRLAGLRALAEQLTEAGLHAIWASRGGTAEGAAAARPPPRRPGPRLHDGSGVEGGDDASDSEYGGGHSRQPSSLASPARPTVGAPAAMVASAPGLRQRPVAAITAVAASSITVTSGNMATRAAASGVQVPRSPRGADLVASFGRTFGLRRPSKESGAAEMLSALADPDPEPGGPPLFMATLPFGPRAGINCCSEAEGFCFMVRSKTYLRNKVKQKGGVPLMRLVGIDWFRDKKRIDAISARPGALPRTHLLPWLAADPQGRSLFVLNLQVPAAVNYSLVFYWISRSKVDPASLLGRFFAGDDRFRNARFKMIPTVAEGSWLVKRSVGQAPVIIGMKLATVWRGAMGGRFLEMDLNVGSSAVANGVTQFVLGVLRSLVIDLAFVLQGNTDAELPETLLGTLRLSHLEPNAAQTPPPLVTKPNENIS